MDTQTANTVFLPSSTRGNTNIGWLNGYHSFNFGSFFEPARQAFGSLVILNDDTVRPGTGFGMHRHRNMEIISIPLSGEVTHRDSKGHEAALKTGDIQLMSAGTGIEHSEQNKGQEDLSFLQIWILPEKPDQPPRYQQMHFGDLEPNRFHELISPGEQEGTLAINQQAWLSLGTFSSGSAARYKCRKPGHGIYIYVIEGDANVDACRLQRRDALALTDTSEVLISFADNTRLLVIDVVLP